MAIYLPNLGNRGVRQLGAGSSNANKAVQNVLRNNYPSSGTRKSYQSRMDQFLTFYKEECGKTNLSKIEKEDIFRYSQELLDRLDDNEESNSKKDPFQISTIRDYLSAVNVTLEHMLLNDFCAVSPEEAGFPPESGICTESLANLFIPSGLSDELYAIVGLQTLLGLRFRESVKIDARAAYEEGLKNGQVTITKGCKGGRPRVISVNSEQIKALKIAADMQEKGHHSLIPPELSYQEFKNKLYNQIRGLGFRFHGERHGFAHRRYEELLSVPAPVLSHKLRGNELYEWLANEIKLTQEQAKELELNARFQISTELGHSRIDIVGAYIG